MLVFIGDHKQPFSGLPRKAKMMYGLKDPWYRLRCMEWMSFVYISGELACCLDYGPSCEPTILHEFQTSNWKLALLLRQIFLLLPVEQNMFQAATAVLKVVAF